jgi:hypothetical protein
MVSRLDLEDRVATKVAVKGELCERMAVIRPVKTLAAASRGPAPKSALRVDHLAGDPDTVTTATRSGSVPRRPSRLLGGEVALNGRGEPSDDVGLGHGDDGRHLQDVPAQREAQHLRGQQPGAYRGLRRVRVQ